MILAIFLMSLYVLGFSVLILSMLFMAKTMAPTGKRQKPETIQGPCQKHKWRRDIKTDADFLASAIDMNVGPWKCATCGKTSGYLTMEDQYYGS